MTHINDMRDLIRPWWRGRNGDHVKADCLILAADVTATEGTGWFNLATAASNLCPACFSWDAECDSCGASLSREERGPHDEAAAWKWTREHFCAPAFTITPLLRPSQPAPSPLSDQLELFALEARR
ncbi:hypothetical protein ACIBEJ_34485 [Nonomuraea sp. NPDC050790]|uniref:hypothetical protein n=1 Tax=Nonomuraea sp. NPDC050790 TaxID=3364371 RepID=UPI0037B1935E